MKSDIKKRVEAFKAEAILTRAEKLYGAKDVKQVIAYVEKGVDILQAMSLELLLEEGVPDDAEKAKRPKRLKDRLDNAINILMGAGKVLVDLMKHRGGNWNITPAPRVDAFGPLRREK